MTRTSAASASATVARPSAALGSSILACARKRSCLVVVPLATCFLYSALPPLSSAGAAQHGSRSVLNSVLTVLAEAGAAHRARPATARTLTYFRMLVSFVLSLKLAMQWSKADATHRAWAHRGALTRFAESPPRYSAPRCRCAAS